MLVLDTNHIRELGYPTERGDRLRDRLERSRSEEVATIVTAAELLKGRLARIAAARDDVEQALGYERLAETLGLIGRHTLLPWDLEAARRFRAFRAQGIRIGTLDLRIACITLEHDATLLTRNTVDFAQVPGLRFENWLD